MGDYGADQLGMAVLGAGYWGPNLVRNIALHPATALSWVCDLDRDRAERLAGTYAGARATDRLEDVLGDPQVEAIAIATPAGTHADLAVTCLRAGKHVLVEKPLASSAWEAEKMIAVARDEQRTLMCDHTYCYTPSVRRIREIVHAGDLGDVLFVDSVRINLGLVQRDVNVLWDLAPHDLAILDHVLPPGRAIQRVAAQGADPIGAGQLCVGYLNLELEGGAIAHVHVNWLSPTKVRTMIIGGAHRTLVWDDLSPTQRISVYDRGVDVKSADLDASARAEARVSYRLGDMVAPSLPEREALASVLDELVSSVRERREPITSGMSGLRVLRILEAAGTSLACGGVAVPVPADRKETF